MLDAVVREAAARYGDAALYVTPEGSELSYAELDRLSDDVALGLRARGVGVGDVVALLLPSGPAYAVGYAAVAKVGALTAGVNDRLSPPERRRCLAVARPKLVVTSKALALGTALDEVAEVQDVVEVDTGAGTDPHSTLRRAARGRPECEHDGPRPRPRSTRGRGVHVGNDRRAQGSSVHMAPARGDR